MRVLGMEHRPSWCTLSWISSLSTFLASFLPASLLSVSTSNAEVSSKPCPLKTDARLQSSRSDSLLSRTLSSCRAIQKDLGLGGLLFVYKGSPFLLPCFLSYLHLQLCDLGLVVRWLVTVFWVQCFCGHPAGLDHTLGSGSFSSSYTLLHWCFSGPFWEESPLPSLCCSLGFVSPTSHAEASFCLVTDCGGKDLKHSQYLIRINVFLSSRVLRYDALDPGFNPRYISHS